VRGCTDIYSSVFAVVLVEYFSFHRRDATRFSAKGCFNCRHLLAASPAAKTVSQGCSAVVPKAVAGASGAYRVAVGKRYQAVYTLYHLRKQLSSREMAWQPQISSAQASTRSICSAGRGSWGDNLGLRHHGRTSIIVPEIDH
jgi:hypothetical protein